MVTSIHLPSLWDGFYLHLLSMKVKIGWGFFFLTKLFMSTPAPAFLVWFRVSLGKGNWDRDQDGCLFDFFIHGYKIAFFGSFVLRPHPP
jgi:hypothetical protein